MDAFVENHTLTKIRKEYWSADRAWHRGFRAGLVAGIVSTVCTLGVGVTVALWL